MNWEIELCITRLQGNIYKIGGSDSPNSDAYAISEYINKLEQEIEDLIDLVLETGEYIE